MTIRSTFATTSVGGWDLDCEARVLCEAEGPVWELGTTLMARNALRG